MRRPRKIAVILAAVIIVGIGFYALRPKQPSYGGKTLEQWLNSSNPIPSEAVHAMGTNCIPMLLETIQARPSAFSRWLHWCLPKLGWHWATTLKISRMKSRATEAFVILGTNGISAVDDLVKILEASRYDSSGIAAFCLAGMGESGMARLVKAFGHKSLARQSRNQSGGAPGVWIKV